MNKFIEDLKKNIKYTLQLNVEYQLSEVITTIKIYVIAIAIYIFFFFHFSDYLNDPIISIVIQLVIGISFIMAAILTIVKNIIIDLKIKNDLLLNKTREDQLYKVIKYHF